MLGKFLFFVTLVNLCFGTAFEVPRTDLVILETGERVEGRVESVVDGVIEIRAENGLRTITRDVNIYSPRDIVESGIITTKRHSGCIKHFDGDILMIQTSSGKHEIKAPLVRKIIISHESALPPLDL